jgi:hypothetical protein
MAHGGALTSQLASIKPLRFPYLFDKFLYRALIIKVRACGILSRNIDVALGLGAIGRLDLMGKSVVGKKRGREKAWSGKGRKLGHSVPELIRRREQPWVEVKIVRLLRRTLIQALGDSLCALPQ